MLPEARLNWNIARVWRGVKRRLIMHAPGASASNNAVTKTLSTRIALAFPFHFPCHRSMGATFHLNGTVNDIASAEGNHRPHPGNLYRRNQSPIKVRAPLPLPPSHAVTVQSVVPIGGEVPIRIGAGAEVARTTVARLSHEKPRF